MTSKIGSKSTVTWTETNWGVNGQFAATGDWMRSARPALEEVIDAGVRTVIYAGDADYIVNYIGVEYMVRAAALSFFFSIPPPSESSEFLHRLIILLCIMHAHFTGRLLEHAVLGTVREPQFQDL